MLILTLCVIIALLVASSAYYIFNLRKNLERLGEALGTAWNECEKAHIAIQDLLTRDQVEAYNALEQGTNELVENYESDRLDLVEKIERLEMERDFLLAQTDDAIQELHARLETYKRAQALHLDTILAYQREKDEIKIPRKAQRE